MRTVASGTHDSFAVTAPPGKAISVKFTVTAGGAVDVFVFDLENLTAYENSSVDTFYTQGGSQNVTFWSGTVSKGTLMYFVVDNEGTTQGGAFPRGSVAYSAEFLDGDITASNANNRTLAIFALTLALVVTVVIVGKRLAVAAAPPEGMPPSGGADALAGSPSLRAQAGAPPEGEEPSEPLLEPPASR